MHGAIDRFLFVGYIALRQLLLELEIVRHPSP